MPRRGLTLLEIFVIVVVVFILAALVVPGSTCRPGRGVRCANNLMQLYKLGTIYASQHPGEWPDPKVENLWVHFSRMTPPLIEQDHLEILACPVRGEPLDPGQTDYLAPRLPFSKLKASDPVAADWPGNHGEGRGGNVLLKDGSVLDPPSSDERWLLYLDSLR